ncbi:Uncharacterised protein [uncultured archaeon]|nr:Uncharacterised protein [uncultured archaeon]
MKIISVPRIIGAILLIAGIISNFTIKSGALFLAVIGIILLIAPTKHAQEMLKLCLQTLKQWKTTAKTFIYDLLFWALAGGAMYLFFKWVTLKATKLQATAMITKESILNPDLVAQNAGAIKGFLIYSITGAIISLLVCLLLYTISREMIWTTIAKTKPTKKFFLKFLLLNLIWWAILAVLYILIVSATGKTLYGKITVIILLIAGAYITVIMQALFTKKQQIGHSLGNSIAFSITKIHKLIVPIVYAVIIFAILSQPLRLINNANALAPSAVLMLVWYAWLRMYLYEIIKKFE